MTDDKEGVIDLGRLRRSCAACSLRSLCLPAGISADELHRLDAVVQTRLPLNAGDALFRAGDEFHNLFVVRAGCIRTTHPASDGDEQVIGFHLPGELLGLDAISEGRHQCDATALERTNLCAVPFDQLEAVACHVPGLQHQVLRIISRELVHDHQHLVALGRRTARARLALFLHSLSERLHAGGYSGADFRLPMSRDDIASYLGLALETVSRLLGRLADEGVIAVERRRVRVLDAAALAEIGGEHASVHCGIRDVDGQTN
ncbi:MAG: helix-turn-helix domain-containing protein [Halofilum sp. (in: g-proteobacteria)]|nr:helix-turn-helix domain-containing protein [Halofilum sp. (in: g-proteobacteria)]